MYSRAATSSCTGLGTASSSRSVTPEMGVLFINRSHSNQLMRPAPTRLTPSRHHAAKFAALREGTSSTLVSPATMPSPGLGKAMKRRPGASGKTSRAARHAATTRSYPKNFCLVDRSEPLRLLFRPASHPFHRYGPSANWQAENQLRELRAWCAIRATRWFGNTSSARAAGRVPIVESNSPAF